MHHRQSSRDKGLSLAFWLNLLFSIVEGVGGMLTNSRAILADAFHDFMDALAIGAAVALERLSDKKRSEQFTYGYRRFSLLAALGMSLLLCLGAVVMAISALESFIRPEPVHSAGMLWLAILGIAVNGFAFLRMRHGGSSSRHNKRAIMLHLLEDVLGWVAVLLGAAVIYFTGWFWIDGVLALGIAGFIGYNAIRNLVPAMRVFLQAVPENVDIGSLSRALLELEGVGRIHDLHVWSLDGSYNVATLHVVIDRPAVEFPGEMYSQLLLIMEQHQIHHPTIQLETEDTACAFTRC